jgi:DNA-binding response OmpR family regulator
MRMPSEVLPFGARRGAASEGLRIFLADDNADTVLTLSALLTGEGHVVRALADGAGVPDLVRDFRPDVCILDIEMPGTNGYVLARDLRDRREGERPLLILALMVGFDHFFQKPADPKELLILLEEFRDGRKAAAFHERVHLARRA